MLLNRKTILLSIIAIAFIPIFGGVFYIHGGVPYYFDSRPLPTGVIEYREHNFDPLGNLVGEHVFTPFRPNVGESYLLKFAEIDREFPFENLKVGDMIQIQFKDKIQVAHENRITEIMHEKPLSFKTFSERHQRSYEGIDYPITEKEYLGKIVQVFDDFESALKMGHGRAP